MLAVVLKQIDAARELAVKHLPERKLSYSSLVLLRREFPNFEPEVCLLKCAAVNDIYGTHLLAIVRAAHRVYDVLGQNDHSLDGAELVRKIADDEGQSRMYTSFASKFCHFFVDAERFPMYDNAALGALKLHFDKDVASHEYKTFCACIADLKKSVGNGCDTRMLDDYLWLTGMYQRWLKQRIRNEGNRIIVNTELLKLFERPTEDQKAVLNDMLPSMLERPFLMRSERVKICD